MKLNIVIFVYHCFKFLLVESVPATLTHDKGPTGENPLPSLSNNCEISNIDGCNYHVPDATVECYEYDKKWYQRNSII